MYISMLDLHGREVSGLRLAVTQRCNQSCVYCHNEGQLPSKREMTVDEIARIVRVAESIGVRKVKITGGEPLLRRDITRVVARCSQYTEEVSLTTNGVLLEGMAEPLREAGLARINISLDTLNRAMYKRITGRDDLPSVLRGIEAAKEAGFQVMKLNAVILKGMNQRDLKDLILFSAQNGALLQLIELTVRKEEVGTSFYRKYHYDLARIERVLRTWASETGANEIHNRKRYLLGVNGSKAVVEIVRPMGNRDFCSNCTRIRVTSDGRIKPCLLTNSGEVDTLHLLESGRGEEALRELFVRVIAERRLYWD